MISSLAAADKLFADVGSAAVQRAAAWRVMSSLAATQQLAGGADTNDEKAEHDALRSLGLFVSQVPAAGRALIAVFKVAGAELAILRKAEQKHAAATAEEDAVALRHAPAQLAQRLALERRLERRIQIAEEELDFALKRSGSAEGDARLAAAERAHANGKNAETAVLAITQLLPGWSWAWRRLATLRRERPGGIADAQAVEWLARATQLAPYDVFAWVELGDMLRAGNDAKGALHAYNEARIRHPTLKALRRLERWMATVESQVVSRHDRSAG
jgi:tetratricopeptide (TPR) repeat protein